MHYHLEMPVPLHFLQANFVGYFGGGVGHQMSYQVELVAVAEISC
jgi:hypothetical protein